jgi:flotillin
MFGLDIGLIVTCIVGGLVMFGLISWIYVSFYQKCGPNEAMIISGSGVSEGDRNFRIIVGGGAVVNPFLQQRAFLSLETMTIDVVSAVPMITKSGVPIFVEGVAQIKVQNDQDAIATAAQQFLNKDADQIAGIAHQTLIGHLRAILGTLEVEELIQNNETFAKKVQEVSGNDLANMGMEIVSFTIKEIKDNVGYIEALGRTQIEVAKRSAAAGAAEQQKLAAIAQANAHREAEIEKSRAQRDTAIFQAQAAQEQATAKLKSDTLVAEASKNFQMSQAAYQAEVASKKASSDMAYDIAKAQTQQQLVQEQQQIKIVEASKEVELQSVAVQRREVELEAEITKPAEAEQTRVRLLAQAEQDKRKLMAEADLMTAKLQAQGQAEATRLRAIADAEAQKALGLAAAEAQRAKGLAEASVIAAKGEAEAEAMAKKAEAFKQYNEAAMASMIVEKLPEMISAAATPLQKIGSMTVLATGDSAGVSKITGDVLNVAAQGMTMVKGLTGVDLAAYMRSDKKKLEETLNKSTT